ncbi:MAG: hypothetical protein H6779_04155 [Candidatus Nomurabacteria bacterium]|nr:MAG: hypothetical protein H6779_04155 [Candidatus Nomurabacteria bacterium]
MKIVLQKAIDKIVQIYNVWSDFTDNFIKNRPRKFLIIVFGTIFAVSVMFQGGLVSVGDLVQTAVAAGILSLILFVIIAGQISRDVERSRE